MEHPPTLGLPTKKKDLPNKKVKKSTLGDVQDPTCLQDPTWGDATSITTFILSVQ